MSPFLLDGRQSSSWPSFWLLMCTFFVSHRCEKCGWAYTPVFVFGEKVMRIRHSSRRLTAAVGIEVVKRELIELKAQLTIPPSYSQTLLEELCMIYSLKYSFFILHCLLPKEDFNCWWMELKVGTLRWPQKKAVDHWLTGVTWTYPDCIIWNFGHL